jgi:hypothetical protein
MGSALVPGLLPLLHLVDSGLVIGFLPVCGHVHYLLFPGDGLVFLPHLIEDVGRGVNISGHGHILERALAPLEGVGITGHIRAVLEDGPGLGTDSDNQIRLIARNSVLVVRQF